MRYLVDAKHIESRLDALQRQLTIELELINTLKEAIRIDAVGATAALAEHITDMHAHTSQSERQMRSEWRDAVTERLSRIEELVVSLHQSSP